MVKFVKKGSKYAKSKRTARRPAKRVSFAARVKKVIKRDAEHKINEYTGASPLFHYNSSSVNFDTNIVPMSPYTGLVQINQGVTQGTRIGNSVRTVKCMAKIWITARNQDGTFNPTPTPQDVRIMVVKSKANPTVLTNTGGLGNLFQFGGASMAPTGTIYDLLQDVNTDVWTKCYDKVFKIGNSSYTGTAANPGSNYFTNNDYKMNYIFKIDMTKHYAKLVKFNDTGSAPIVPLLQLVVLPCNANGLSAPTVNVTPLYWGYTLTYSYTDE